MLCCLLPTRWPTEQFQVTGRLSQRSYSRAGRTHEQPTTYVVPQDLIATCFPDCRTRAWVVANAEARIKQADLFSRHTLSASGTPPAEHHRPSSAAGIHDIKKVAGLADGELSNADDDQQMYSSKARAEDDDESSCDSCLSSEVRLRKLKTVSCCGRCYYRCCN